MREFVLAWANRLAISGVVATTISAPAVAERGAGRATTRTLRPSRLAASAVVLDAAYRLTWSPTRRRALTSASSTRNGYASEPGGTAGGARNLASVSGSPA